MKMTPTMRKNENWANDYNQEQLDAIYELIRSDELKIYLTLDQKFYKIDK